MIKGFFWLVLAYGLSQFYRACMAVFAPVLGSEIGVTAADISTALGYWFLAFAAMQIPVGWLLDRKSPRLTAAILLLVGGGCGALVFASAQGAGAISLAMLLIGVGCSPVLMTSFYIFAREASPTRFGTLAGLVLGIGSLGNLVAASPLTWSFELIGWRATLVVLAGVTALVALALAVFVKDPERLVRDTSLPQKGLIDILTYWPLYPVLAIALVAYAPGAGLRGSWIGGYLSDIYGLDAGQIGTATLFMAGAMIAGSFIFGAADRVATPRNVVLMSSGFGLAAVVVLWLTAGNASLFVTVGLFMAIGFAASNYPQVINQGRAMMPPELVGRGVTLVNLFSIGGVGLGQMVTARAFDVAGGEQLDAYRTVFGVFGGALAIGLVVFLIGRESRYAP